MGRIRYVIVSLNLLFHYSISFFSGFVFGTLHTESIRLSSSCSYELMDFGILCLFVYLISTLYRMDRFIYLVDGFEFNIITGYWTSIAEGCCRSLRRSEKVLSLSLTRRSQVWQNSRELVYSRDYSRTAREGVLQVNRHPYTLIHTSKCLFGG